MRWVLLIVAVMAIPACKKRNEPPEPLGAEEPKADKGQGPSPGSIKSPTGSPIQGGTLPGTPKSQPAFAAKTLPQYFVIDSLAVSRDGSRLAAYGMVYADRGAGRKEMFRSLRAWDVDGGSPEFAREYGQVEGQLRGPLAFSPDRNILAVCTGHQLVCRKAATGELVSSTKFGEIRHLPYTMAFTQDSRAVVLAGGKVMLTIAAANGQQTVKRPKMSFSAFPAEPVYVPAINRVAEVHSTGLQGSELCLWDPASDGPPVQIRLDTQGWTTAFAMSPDGRLLAVCHPPRDETKEKGRVAFYNPADGKKLGELPPDDAPNFRVYSALVFSHDGKYLAGIGRGGNRTASFNSIDLYRVADGRRLYRASGEPPPSELNVSHAFASLPVFSPDGKWLAYVYQDRTVVRVDTETGAVIPFKGSP